MLKIFSSKNFTYLFAGRVIANIGDSFYIVAAMWLVYSLGGSTFYTGLALFLTTIPSVFQFLVGPIIDKFSLKRLLVFTQITQAILLLLLPVLYYSNLLTITAVLIIMPIISLLNDIMYPAQFSALPRILPKEQLTNGNSLFTLAYQGSSLAFNGIAGIVVAAVGSISIFIFNSFAFVFSALIFMAVSVPALNSNAEKANVKDNVSQYINQLKEGFSLVTKPIFSRLLFGAVFVNFAGAAIFAILPEFSDAQGGANVYGFYLAAGAGGGILGALLAPNLKLERFPLGKVFATAFFISGICWISAGLTPFYLSIIIYFIAWVPTGIINILAYTFIQTLISERMLTTVMATTFSLVSVATPIGALLGGFSGTMVASNFVISLAGVCLIFVSVFWILDKFTRNIPCINDLNPSDFGIETDENVLETAR